MTPLANHQPKEKTLSCSSAPPHSPWSDRRRRCRGGKMDQFTGVAEAIGKVTLAIIAGKSATGDYRRLPRRPYFLCACSIVRISKIWTVPSSS
ncbi:hypothetical protein [Methanogenium cariaci]|uniref:hypothetical protein n=1 Tax=Methanogenium cariaci TaxID=2197 RepID=UPI0012F6F9D9|nr:hypothetical protein [Methanogenium cariaci]